MADPKQSDRQYVDELRQKFEDLKRPSSRKEEIKEIDYGQHSSENIEFEDCSDDFDVEKYYESSDRGLDDVNIKKAHLDHQISAQNNHPQLPKKHHFSDGEINIENEIIFSERPLFNHPKYSLEELKSPEYIVDKCTFCFVTQKQKENQISHKNDKKSKSIFDKDSSGQSSLNIQEVQKLYQDLSNDDIKTNIDTDLFKKGIDSHL